jgi:hypothetical protein
MYKPWPKCPKCSQQTLLIPPKEKGGTVNAYECPECEIYWDGEPTKAERKR